jgi:AAA15 family ATPase/GTPase
MEKSGTVSSGYLASDQILTDKFNRSLDIVKDQIKEAFVVADYADDQSRNRLEQIRNQLDGLIMSKGFSDLIDRNILSKNVLVNYDSSFFTDIDIKCYRGISGLTLKKLEQINVFTGANNAGKTSVLEAIYLLAQQNNSDAFFDVLRRRAKLDGLDAVWVDSNFTDTVEVSGIYNDVNASNKIYKSVEESDLIDKSDYLSTIMMEGEFGSNVSNSRVELYEHSKQKTFVKSINVICNATLSSPFSLQNSDTILQAHASSVKSNTMKKIIEFISINIDSGIQDIQLSDSGRGRRFNVTHSDFENKSLDLSQFGDGLQRVFFISLLFSSAKNGIILIDELENAIHYKLLTKFSAFIQQLAKEFNVQVFITSHSNECVEALMSTSSSPNDIVFYHLDRTDNEVKAKRLTGGRYKELLTVMEIDLR